MQTLENKANKQDIISKDEVQRKFDRLEKMVSDNTRRIIDVENKNKTVENEIQEIHQSIKMLQRKIDNLPTGGLGEASQSKNYDPIIE